MGIEEQIDRLIDAGDDILKSLKTLNERVAEVAERFSTTVPVVADPAPAEPPPAKPKRWRYREGHEIVQAGDWANSVDNLVGYWPPAGGWMDASSCVGQRVEIISHRLRIACEVTDDANEADQSADAPAEAPKPLEPEWREPVLPADCGKRCEFSDDGSRWFTLDLAGFNNCFHLPWLSRTETWRFARIKKDA